MFDISSRDMAVTKAMYQKQCPEIWKQAMESDEGLLQILTIGRKNHFDYLMHLVDDFHRSRIQHIDQPR